MKANVGGLNAACPFVKCPGAQNPSVGILNCIVTSPVAPIVLLHTNPAGIYDFRNDVKLGGKAAISSHTHDVMTPRRHTSAYTEA